MADNDAQLEEMARKDWKSRGFKMEEFSLANMQGT